MESAHTQAPEPAVKEEAVGVAAFAVCQLTRHNGASKSFAPSGPESYQSRVPGCQAQLRMVLAGAGICGGQTSVKLRL